MPVAVGAACAVGAGDIAWWRVALALVVSVALQVGVNFANDYSDGVRGTDDARVGPTRLVASGLVSPSSVRAAALVALGVAAGAGAVLAIAVSWWLLGVGAAALAAAWLYTGGPNPYGYLGLGEVFVFVFFGLVATMGTTYVAVQHVTGPSVVMGTGAGFLACALLVINNLRDIPSDTNAGKRTLAVRLGDRRTRWFYALLVGAAFGCAGVTAGWRWEVLLVLATVPLAAAPVRAVAGGVAGAGLVPVLGSTSRLQIAYGLAAAVGLAVGG